MKYYKAPINQVNGEKIYGNLPERFVIGYETITDAYFELQDGVLIPDDSGVVEIDQIEYEKKVQEITHMELEQRKQEEQAFLEELAKKQQVINLLQSENILLKAQNQANADRADFQEELIVELAMRVYP